MSTFELIVLGIIGGLVWAAVYLAKMLIRSRPFEKGIQTKIDPKFNVEMKNLEQKISRSTGFSGNDFLPK